MVLGAKWGRSGEDSSEKVKESGCGWVDSLCLPGKHSREGEEEEEAAQSREEGTVPGTLVSTGASFSHPLRSSYCAKRGRHWGVKGLTRDQIVCVCVLEEVNGEASGGKVRWPLICGARHARPALAEPTPTLSDLAEGTLGKGTHGSAQVSGPRFQDGTCPRDQPLCCGSPRNRCRWAISIFCEGMRKGISFACAIENKHKSYTKPAATVSWRSCWRSSRMAPASHRMCLRLNVFAA